MKGEKSQKKVKTFKLYMLGKKYVKIFLFKEKNVDDVINDVIIL